MEDGKYFREALASMTANIAYVGAVRHLYDLGMKPEEIQKKITYPVSLEKIENVLQKYEEEKASTDEQYEYVQYTDQYGRKNFIRVKNENPKEGSYR